ncbi:MAG: DUF2997 domain-containing protein [Candidatus Nezhaarchaeota archaeon]|nr:DUF2997 domain-containing protein [Candidatus Nezhaarchaeota archaeon]
MKNIEIIVNRDGSITIRFQGFIGQECLEEAKRLYERLRALGISVTIEKTVPTQELYATQRQEVKRYEVL